MTINEFCVKYQGQKVDFDGFAGAQCVDLARQFMKDVQDIPEHTGACATSGGAKDLYLDYEKMSIEKKYFRQVNKDYKIGDLMVWGETSKNKFGHVAIFLACDPTNMSVLVFEQDGFAQDGAKYNWRPLSGVLGALRLK